MVCFVFVPRTWVSNECFVLVSLKVVINKMSRSGKLETLRKIKTRSWGAVMAPAAWQLPEEIDANQFAVFEKRHSIRKLKDMAERMGLDTHLSKRNLALTVFTGTNVFFKSEIGNYSRETLLHFIRSFQILELKPSVEESLTNEHMRKLLLSVYEGGSHTDMVGHMDDLLLLYDQMMMMEQKFCSHYFQEILRSEVASEKMSMVDYIAQRLDDATERFDRWMTSSEKDRRVLYQDFLLHKERVRGMIQEFGSLIHEYCAKSTDVCADGNFPKALKEWYETSPNTRLIACNVTVRGKLVDFRKGDRVMNGRYKVSKVVEGMHQHHPVRWVGLVRLAKNLLQEEDEEKEDKDKKDKKEPRKNDPWYKILLHAIWSQKTQILMHLLNSRVGVVNAIKVPTIQKDPEPTPPDDTRPIFGPENASEEERLRWKDKLRREEWLKRMKKIVPRPPPPDEDKKDPEPPLEEDKKDPEPPPPDDTRPIFGPENLSEEERRRWKRRPPPVTPNVQTSHDPFAVENKKEDDKKDPETPPPEEDKKDPDKEDPKQDKSKADRIRRLLRRRWSSRPPPPDEDKKDPEPPPPDETGPIFGPENLSPKERILFELKRRLRPPYAEAGLSLFEAAMAKLKEDMVNMAGEIPEATQRLINLYEDLLKSSQQGSQVPPFVYFYRLALEKMFEMDPNVKEQGFQTIHKYDAARMAAYLVLQLQSMKRNSAGSAPVPTYNATVPAADFEKTPFHDMKKLNPVHIMSILKILIGNVEYVERRDKVDRHLANIGAAPVVRSSRVVEAEAFMNEDAQKLWTGLKERGVSARENLQEDIYKFHIGQSASYSLMWKYTKSIANPSEALHLKAELDKNLLQATLREQVSGWTSALNLSWLWNIASWWYGTSPAVTSNNPNTGSSGAPSVWLDWSWKL